ncbi:MAG: cobalamin-dependent protein [Oscillospiraceae bacterium]|nr:cobalamin-dependent protein [Oscillospiraceae bacterium]
MIQNMDRVEQENTNIVTSDTVLSELTVCDEIYSIDSPLTQTADADLVEISIVVSGNGIHRVFNDTTECQTGDMYILKTNIPHGYYAKNNDEKPTVRRIVFDPAIISQNNTFDLNDDSFCYGVFRDKLPISYALLNSKTFHVVEDLCKNISEELQSKGTNWEEAVKSHLSLLMINISRYINMAETLQLSRHKEWITVSRAIKLIEEHCRDYNMTLESIAAELFISPSHLSRLFPKVLGESFLNYLRNLRVTTACNLLTNTNLTNTEIVARCGMRDIPSFYKLFKSVMGETPYQYRMTQHSNQNNKGEKSMELIEISENLQKGKAKVVKELVQKAIDEGIPAAKILNDGLIHGMNIVGEKFKNNEVYVPEVLVAAHTMNMGTQILKPLLLEDGIESSGKVCLGTVQGDLHDIGKNLVKMMMEGKGLEVVDLGTDVSPETFVRTAIEQNCQVIACSALLTTTMGAMEAVVEECKKAGIRDQVKVMIGGAPISQEYCDKIGADCYTPDAASAAEAAVELCKK